MPYKHLMHFIMPGYSKSVPEPKSVLVLGKRYTKGQWESKPPELRKAILLFETWTASNHPIVRAQRDYVERQFPAGVKVTEDKLIEYCMAHEAVIKGFIQERIDRMTAASGANKK